MAQTEKQRRALEEFQRCFWEMLFGVMSEEQFVEFRAWLEKERQRRAKIGKPEE
jgi:hypothetical protein